MAKKIDNKKIAGALAFLIVLLIISGGEGVVKPITVAPACFSKDDCFKPLNFGYCGIEYDCIVGTCYYEDIPCPEICNNDKDDDLDNLIDCKDPDCVGQKYCVPNCWVASFGDCNSNDCWCDAGVSKWFPADGCKCI